MLTGLAAYKRMFATFRFARKTLVHDLSTVFRISYDGSRQQVGYTACRVGVGRCFLFFACSHGCGIGSIEMNRPNGTSVDVDGIIHRNRRADELSP